MDNLGRAARAFLHERGRHDPRTHRRRHQQRLQRFLREVLPRAPYYAAYAGRPLPALPVVDKATVLADFAAFNTRGITLERALALAEEAERTRDFTPTLDGVTVGLSSGTSGRRGVFLLSPEETALWSGTLLGRMLTTESLRLLVTRRLRVALFLRADSNVYQSLGSRRLDFGYHDLTMPWEEHLQRLRAVDVLVAPASVLRTLAQQRPDLRPVQVVSVAETLEPDDAAVIERAWGRRVDQIYQATEGLLATSCAVGRLHLNESFVHVEPDWLDEEHTRFTPIVTDFARTTQLVVRYRLDDVLLAAEGPCPCGRADTSVAAVLGRADDVLTTAGGVRVHPDVLRHAMALAGPEDYRIEQHDETWRVALRGGSLEAVRREVALLADRLGGRPPMLEPMAWPAEDPAAKRRRIRYVRRAGLGQVVA